MRDRKYKNLVKKGCVFKTNNNYENINFSSQTIDKVDFRSVILSMGGWFIVDVDYKPRRKIEKLLQQITNTIKLNSNKHYFNGMIIDVSEIPETFNEQKRGYVTFEFTIFINKGIRFNKTEITMVMNEMIKTIYNDYFKEPIDFEITTDRDYFRSRLETINWNPDEYFPGDETPVNERL
jgi:hypothetical protein